MAQLDIRNPICDSCTTRSLKPIVIHTAQLDIRNPICDSCAARSHKPMEIILDSCKVTRAYEGLYNTMGYICDSCTARPHKLMEGHTAQWDIRNPICDSCTT